MRWLLPLWLLSLPSWLLTTTTAGAQGAPLQSSPPVPQAAPQEPPPAAGEETYVEPAEDEDRVSTGFRLSEASGGGRVEVLAGDFEYQEGQYFLATGGVTIKYRDLQLQADVVRVDVPTNMITAEGSVVLDEGPRRLVGRSLEYDLTNRTGRVTEATAYLDPGYIFSGEEIAKVDADTYTLDRGVFTSCSEDRPPWSIHMSRAEVTVESYARIKNARMNFGRVPVFYVPYMLWPTKTERSSGFLVPQPGYSNRRGFELSLGYYKTLGRSADMSLYTDLSSEEYFGFGTELRYRPSETTEGIIEAYLVQDQDFKRLRELGFVPAAPFTLDDLPEENRWKASWYHDARDVLGGFRGVINFQDYSDATYRQDFERHTGRQTASFIYSQAYLTRNFGQQSLNLLVDLRERVNSRSFTDPDPNEREEERRIGQITDTRQQLPEIEYRLRPTQLGSAPIYFSVDANLHYLSIENRAVSRLDGPDGMSGEPIAERYGRGDLFPSFSLPVSTLPWLSVKLDVGGRVTHYTNSIDPATRRFSEEDRELTRTFGVAGAEVVGPTLSRIFEKKKPGRFSKLKHIIEPRFVYSYVDNFDDTGTALDDDQDEVPLFDEIDSRRLANQATVSLINRFLAKPTDENEGGGFEIASFELQQAFSFDDEIFLQAGNDAMQVRQRTSEGPIRAIFRFNPSQATSLKTEATYNTLFGQLQAASLSGGTRFGPHNVGGSLFTRWGSAEDADVTSNQVRLFTSLALVPNRLTFDANVSYDIQEEEILQQRYFIDFLGSCYSLRFELRESTFGQVIDRDFRFSFTLKNVGTFLDMNGSL